MSDLILLVHWLLEHRSRAVLTMLSVTAAFVLFGLLQGMNQGVDAMLASVTADRLLVASRSSPVGFLPLSHLERIRRMPGVLAAAPMSFFGGYFQEPRNALPVFATDIQAFFDVYPELSVSPAALRAMSAVRIGALVSRPIADQQGWKPGETLPLGSSAWPRRAGGQTWPVTIVGVYSLPERSNLPNMVLLNHSYFDAGRTRLNGATNDYIVRVDGRRSAREIAAGIDAAFANSDGETRTLTERELVQGQIQQAADIKLVADVITGAVLFMLLFVTGNTLTLDFRERTAQLAVLRSFGFTAGRVTALVLGEAALLCLSSAGAGLAIARLLFPWGRATAFPDHSVLASVYMPLDTIGSGLGIAALLALASALPAAWRIARTSIAAALGAR